MRKRTKKREVGRFTVVLKDAKLADKFTDFADKRGLKKARIIEGAIRAFLTLSLESQTKFIAGVPNKKSKKGIRG